jgi:hypothetical protein
MGALVNLRITPEKNAHTRRIDSDFFLNTSGGYFMAKIDNNDPDNQTFEAFNLAPGDSAYIWAGLLADGTRKIAVFHIMPDGAATMVAYARAANWCPPRPGSPQRTIAGFHIHGHPYCSTNRIYALQAGDSQLAAGPSKGSMLSFASNPLAVSPLVAAASLVHTTGLWFSCQMGCCEAQNTY